MNFNGCDSGVIFESFRKKQWISQLSIETEHKNLDYSELWEISKKIVNFRTF